MKKVLLFAALIATGFAGNAMAAPGGVSGVAGSVDAHFDSSTLSGSGSFSGSGSQNAQTASGFTSSLGGSNGVVAFASQGLANSTSTSTPFSATSTSFHEGSAGGFALGGTSFNASQVQTFAQGTAQSGFSVNLNETFQQTDVNFNAEGELISFESGHGHGGF